MIAGMSEEKRAAIEAKLDKALTEQDYEMMGKLIQPLESIVLQHALRPLMNALQSSDVKGGNPMPILDIMSPLFVVMLSLGVILHQKYPESNAVKLINKFEQASGGADRLAADLESMVAAIDSK